ncbi:hypothetical protein Moror_15211 [Moniliophthora roreri MCA 2997]|uniref:PARP catalytic domain-containing protein n=1 Tax=Moniliophthora roreri (strain MCA 2997) TaxID=1381753 RepID=V2X1S5_MONRO|nr:hypothetical protein Moror_15211 [Moniliophthora roreri MCA 2997]
MARTSKSPTRIEAMKQADNQEPGRLILMKPSSSKYQEIQTLFHQGWKHPEKFTPKIKAIFLIAYPHERLEPYRKYRRNICPRSKVEHANRSEGGSNEQFLFHGTARSCSLGDDKTCVLLCSRADCYLCCIIAKSYDVKKCGTRHKFRRFGAGIYTTACSSKADDYFHSWLQGFKCRVTLVNRVVVGKACRRRYNATELTKPPPGYHSVVGVPGADLNYEETVIYDDDAIHPAFLIAYTDSAESQPQSRAAALLSTLFKTPVAS